MTELRIIILIIGLIILALIYYFCTRKKTKIDNVEDRTEEYKEPDLGLNLSVQRPNDLPRRKSVLTDSHTSIDGMGYEKIVTLFIHAKDGQQFDWYMINTAAEKVGLEFGKDNIFHRYNGFGDDKQLIFLVANMLKPGVFQPDLRTTGLVFIMTLPATMPALDMWDTMFPVGERMAELLGGKLTDENHHIFSRQRIASMREEMREFDHQHHS